MNDAIDCAGGDNHTIVLKKTVRYIPGEITIMDNSVTIQLPTEHLLLLFRFMITLMC